MKNVLLCLQASLWLAPALAASKTTVVGESASPELVLPLGSLPERVCWYQDQKYSLGSRIQQGDLWLECGPQNALESNGPLAWREPAVLQPPGQESSNKTTIRVGQ